MIVLLGRRSRQLSGVEYCNLAVAETLTERRVEHEWISLAASSADTRGAASLAAVTAVSRGLLRLLVIAVRRPCVVVYMQPSQGGLPLARDVVVALLARLLPSCYLVLHLHGEFRAELAPNRIGVTLRRVAFALLARSAHRVLSCIGRHVFGGRPTVYIPNTALLSRLVADARGAGVDPTSVHRPATGRVGYIGVITPGKDVDVLVEATAGRAKLRLVGPVNKLPDALSGRIDLADFRRRLDAPHVQLLGSRAGVAKWQEMATWDVACFPSRSEGLPLAALEARVLGVPVVSYAVGDLANLAAHDPGVIAVSPGDRDAFAAAVHAVLEDRGRFSATPGRLKSGASYGDRVLAALQEPNRRGSIANHLEVS